MGKSTRNRNKVKKKSPEPKKPAPEHPLNQDDKQKSGYDFGGLPNLNLKKNLGCG